MLARVRKAVIAGAGAGAAAGLAVLGKADQLDRDSVGQALGAFLVAAAVTAFATLRVPNAA
jgi:hypothetical protein